MRTISVVLFLTFFTLSSFGQNEDPAKIFSIKKMEQLDSYMKKNEWRKIGMFKDSIDGDYALFRKKSVGGGRAYAAIFPFEYLHYQVFFSEKKDYSRVLSYDDFTNMPEGKSRYNYSSENKSYAIKSIEFDDPVDTRNSNIFYGKITMLNGEQIKLYDPYLHEDTKSEWELEMEEQVEDRKMMMEDYNEKIKKEEKEEKEKPAAKKMK